MKTIRLQTDRGPYPVAIVPDWMVGGFEAQWDDENGWHRLHDDKRAELVRRVRDQINRLGS